jgi:hypothetical protein
MMRCLFPCISPCQGSFWPRLPRLGGAVESSQQKSSREGGREICRNFCDICAPTYWGNSQRSKLLKQPSVWSLYKLACYRL